MRQIVEFGEPFPHVVRVVPFEWSGIVIQDGLESETEWDLLVVQLSEDCGEVVQIVCGGALMLAEHVEGAGGCFHTGNDLFRGGGSDSID